MKAFGRYKNTLRCIVAVSFSLYLGVVYAEPCILDEASDDFLLPNNCTVETPAGSENVLEALGIELTDIRFGKVDEITGNVIRIGAANHTISAARLIFDTSDDDCESTIDQTSIQEEDEIAFFAIPNFIFNDAISDQRPVNIIWILDCEIVQDR